MAFLQVLLFVALTLSVTGFVSDRVLARVLARVAQLAGPKPHAITCADESQEEYRGKISRLL